MNSSALKFLYHWLIDGKSRWYPLLALYYLSYRCDFRCPYCSNGAGIAYPKLSAEALPFAEAVKVLHNIRRFSEHLMLTGGEPLQHPDFGRIIESLPSLRFKSLSLNTNGDRLAEELPRLTRVLTTLVVSLDTLNAHKADAWFGCGDGVLERILAHLEMAKDWPKRRYEIMISAVATPNNLDDLYAVYDYAMRSGFQFALCPEIQGTRPAPKLRDNAAYRRLFDFLIAEKKKKRPVFGTVRSLQHMRDFSAFRCHPLAILAIDPEGRIFYPCLERGKSGALIQETESLHALRRRLEDASDCPENCPSACALNFSLAIEKP